MNAFRIASDVHDIFNRSDTATAFFRIRRFSSERSEKEESNYAARRAPAMFLFSAAVATTTLTLPGGIYGFADLTQTLACPS